MTTGKSHAESIPSPNVITLYSSDIEGGPESTDYDESEDENETSVPPSVYR